MLHVEANKRILLNQALNHGFITKYPVPCSAAQMEAAGFKALTFVGTQSLSDTGSDCETKDKRKNIPLKRDDVISDDSSSGDEKSLFSV